MSADDPFDELAGFSRALQSTVPALRSPSSAARSATTETGRWGPFTLLEMVGQGATGEVWRAWDASLQRDVAIKFLQSNVSEGGGVSPAGLLEEARAVARVRHPGVVTVHGIAEHDGRAGMWMEFLRGPTLATEIERRGGLPPREVARVGLQLAAALEALDQAGLVHRDLKPANIVLEADGRAVLADFGLGWRRALLDDETRRGAGTPMFMAPALLHGEPATPRSDLYALGVTLRWALAGRCPFHARGLEELKEEAARGPRTPLAEECPGAPAPLVEAIERAMETKPGAPRFSAADMSTLLRLALDETSTGVTDSGARQAAAANAPVLSIAVLPFLNHSRNEEEEYFSDGLADELLNVLAKIRGLRVAARTSSFQFKGRGEDLATIGRRLNVATVVEGGVRRAGNRIRIAVRLVKVADGFQVWSGSYDRTLEDIFEVQDDIARSVVKELRQALLGETMDSRGSAEVRDAVEKAVRGRGQNAEAHRLYLYARYFLDRLTREDTAKGIRYMRESLDLDPNAAVAWAILGRGLVRQADVGWAPVVEGFREAREAVERALALEPDLAEGHAVMGRIQMSHDWDWRSAQASLRRALESAPGNVVVLLGAGELARNLGRYEESIQLIQRAVEQDPLGAGCYVLFGLALQASERFAEAETAFRKALDLVPDRVGAHAGLALALLALGRREEAVHEAGLEPDEAFRLWVVAITTHAAGRRAESDEALRVLTETYGGDSAYQIAEAHAARGEAEAAFDWLDRAYEQRDGGLLTEMKPSPFFRSLHADPRWTALLGKLGLEA